MHRKFCYQSATKFSTVILTRELRCILLEWACGGLSDCEELVGVTKGDDGVGIMKIVTMFNGKDVLWSTYLIMYDGCLNIKDLN